MELAAFLLTPYSFTVLTSMLVLAVNLDVNRRHRFVVVVSSHRWYQQHFFFFFSLHILYPAFTYIYPASSSRFLFIFLFIYLFIFSTWAHCTVARVTYVQISAIAILPTTCMYYILNDT